MPVLGRNCWSSYTMQLGREPQPRESPKVWHRSLALAFAVIGLVHIGAGWYFADHVRAGALEVVQPSAQPDDDTASSDIGEPFRYSGTPLSTHGISFDEISFESPLGQLDGWHIPAGGKQWLIFVHGKSGSLNESLRIIPALHGNGIDVLVINYRNDDGAPTDPSGFYRQGLTEWEDLAAAVDYAHGRPAEQLSVLGSSMGGAIATNYLLQASNTDHVTAVVLDSPMLDFEAAVDLQADQFHVPGSIRFAAKTLARWRFGVDWQAANYVNRAELYDTPILIFHGTDDTSVPIAPSRELAAARPDLIGLVETQGAEHVSSWNADNETYERELLNFLSSS